MSIEPSKVKFVGSRPSFVGITDKDFAALQVKKATLQNEIDALRIQYNDYSVKLGLIQNNIKFQQNIYDSLPLKTLAELQAQEEVKLNEVKSELQKEQTNLTEILNQITLKKIDLEAILVKLSGLNEDHKNKIQIFNQEIQFNKDNLNKAKDESNIVSAILAEINGNREMADKRLVSLLENIQMEREKQQQYAAFLDKKSKDLDIWENRLNIKFQETHPGESIKIL